MRLKQKHTIKLICMDSFSDFIDIKNYELNYSMFSLPLTGDGILETSKNQNKAFMKVNYFVKSILDGSITYTIDDSIRMKTVFGEAKNNFITLPDFSETTLLETIHSKLSVLCGESTFIDQISLKDLETEIGYELISEPVPEYNLPEIDEWVSDFSFYTEPWWMRYDISTFDDEAVDAEELDKFRNAAADEDDQELAIIDGDIDAIFDIDNNAIDNNDILIDDKRKPGELINLAEVKKGKWKPEIV